MKLYDPPENTFCLLKTEVSTWSGSDYAGPFAEVEVYFVDTKEGDVPTCIHRRIGWRPDDEGEPGSIFSPLTQLREGVWKYGVIAAWTPATKGLARELRNFREHAGASSAPPRYYFPSLIASLDRLAD